MQPEALNVDQTPTKPQEQTPVVQEGEDINWKKFREEREQDRKMRMEAEKRAAEKEAETAAIKAAFEAVVNKPAPYQNDNQYENQNEISESERIKKLVAEQMQEERKKNAEIQRENERKNLPNTLKTAYNDFDQIVSQENMDYLEYHYPEVATPYAHMPDSFDKWAGVYKAIKRFMPNAGQKKELAKLESNTKKPQSLSSQGVSTPASSGAPVHLDEARKMANWARMERIRKGLD